MPLSNTPSWPGTALTQEQAGALNEIGRKHLASRKLFNRDPRDIETNFQHPWRATGSRFTDQKWRINVNPGTINDELALYIYLAQGDPRGWKMPKNFIPPYRQPGTPNIVFRSSFDNDSQWNPPFLLVTAPDAPGVDLGDFIDITDARPAYFSAGNPGLSSIAGVTNLGRMGGAMNTGLESIAAWPLYQASVVLSASPYPGANQDFTKYIASLTTQLNKFTLIAGQMPGINDNVDAGSFLELARLYLLRNPAAPITGDQLFIKQLHFWCLQCLAVQPSFGIGTLEDNTDYGAMIGAALSPIDGGLTAVGLGLIGVIGDEDLDQAQTLLDQSQTVEFWTA